MKISKISIAIGISLATLAINGFASQLNLASTPVTNEFDSSKTLWEIGLKTSALDIPTASKNHTEESNLTYNPPVYKVGLEISDKLQLEILDYSSPSSNSFFVWADPYEIERLKTDYRVESTRQVNGKIKNGDSEKASTEQTSFSTKIAPLHPNDQIVSGQVIPWAKAAVGASSGTSSVPAYIVDQANDGMTAAAKAEINLLYNLEDNFYPLASYHPSMVAGIIGSKDNTTGVVGINPSQPIYLFSTDPNDIRKLSLAIEAALTKAETNNHFATLNLSINSSIGSTNYFSHDSEIAVKMRKASNRLLVVQSAGNSNSDACLTAYSAAPDQTNSTVNPSGAGARHNDGIIVVSGHNFSGQRTPTVGIEYPMPARTTWPVGVVPILYDNVPAAAYGKCVEAWAPSHEITSNNAYNGSPNADTPPQIHGSYWTLSGTSFAAPITAAVASRFGNSATRPIVRENYIKSQLVSTSNPDGGGGFIKKVRVGDTSPTYQLKYIKPTLIRTSTSTTDIPILKDGKFYGANEFAFPQNFGTLYIDLGSAYNLHGIRVTIRTKQSGIGAEANLPFHFGLYAGNATIDTANTSIIAYNEPSQADYAPVFIPINGSYRFLRLDGYNPSETNLRYAEIEVYSK